MKSNFNKIVTLATVVLVFSFGNTVFAGHDGESNFTGVIENLPGAASFIGDWRVAGKTVHVTSSTLINQDDGHVAVGATVKVEGTTRADGSVDAASIEVRQGSSGGGSGSSGGSGSGGGEDQGSRFEGTIESFPNTPGFIGDWRVGGRTIHVISTTLIEAEFGPIAVGAFVEIRGSARTDGSIDATRIETESNVAGGDGRDELTGAIEALPGGLVGDWRISGRTVHVTAATIVDQEHGAAVVGASVEASGTLRTDGSLDARRIEVKSVSATPGAADGGSSFKGTIESFPSTSGFIGDWRVGGRTIHVTSATRIEPEFGPVAVGAFVEIQGALQADGSITATKIETKSNVAGGDGRDELKGAIEALPSAGFIGDWRINGRSVHVTSATVINQEHGAASVGAFVEVTGTRRADGSIDATRIEVQPSAGSGGSGGSGSEGEPTNVKGAIQGLPSSGVVGDWTVNGRLVHVVSSTKLNAEHRAFVIGARVKVKGMLMADGSVVATKVQLRDSN